MYCKDYERLRKEYPLFRYKDFKLFKEGSVINIEYRFATEGLCEFRPKITIETDNLNIINDFSSKTAQRIVFLLGMVEAVSYLKAALSPVMKVECGYLSEDEKFFFKKLYFNGLGEFFYKNGVKTDFNDFLEIECEIHQNLNQDKENNFSESLKPESAKISGYSLIPVGGGKDSAVAIELVKKVTPKILFFTINDQKARTDTVKAAGYHEKDIVKTKRTIDKNLLELNKRGFLNGHTPFSGIVAFLSFYCAYILGCENIILSNESSANDSNIEGENINHQYSKSFEFENDFLNFSENIVNNIKYFSILRPFSEIQIAKYFCRFDKYLYTFRSCNKGSKENKWCLNCPKCLFVFGVLSPFLPYEKLVSVFGGDMLNDPEMEKDFDGLTGLAPVKPFECVGTAREFNYALSLTLKKLIENHEKIPFLLKKFADNFDLNKILSENIMKNFDKRNFVPKKFSEALKEFYDYVGK